MTYSYPLLLDVTDRLAVIIGGGSVAARKASGLLEAGCRQIRVVAPSITARMPQEVQAIKLSYDSSQLDDADLVFAATDDPNVNAAVVADARARDILVCRADSDEQPAGDFANGAVLRQGGLTIAIWAGGSPAIAAALRDELAAAIEPTWQKIADWVLLLRPLLRDSAELKPDERRTIFRDLATPEARQMIATQGSLGVWNWLRGRHPILANVDDRARALLSAKG